MILHSASLKSLMPEGPTRVWKRQRAARWVVASFRCLESRARASRATGSTVALSEASASVSASSA